MRIIYLDQATFLPPQWHERFAGLGDFQAFDDHPDPDTAVRRLCDADLAIVESTPLPGELLRRVTRLRYLTVATNGFHGVDLDAATAAGITVAHCPEHSRQAVAEYVYAVLLESSRGLIAADRAARGGACESSRPFPKLELRGRTMGLLGAGRIAGRVAQIAAGFEMSVIGTNRTGAPVDGLTVVPLEELLRRADVLSVHLPLDATTRGILNARRLALLRESTVLINTSRGELIDHTALARMLSTGRLAGACLDHVGADDADTLRALDNVVLTPGTAWHTDTARTANLHEIYDNLAGFLAGHPRNVVADAGSPPHRIHPGCR